MSRANKAYLYAITAVLFWSTVATAFKIALDHLDIYQLVFYASLASATVLLIPLVIRRQLGKLWQEGKAHWRFTLLVASLNPICFYLVLFAGYDRLPAQVAQPINYTWAIVLTFMSVIFLRQKPTRFDFAAAFICYIGVVVIATRGTFAAFEFTNLAGLMLVILSTFIWSGYWILNMKDIRDQRFAMCLNFVMALPVSFLICLVFSTLYVTPVGIASASYVGVFEMGLAFLFWSKALRLAENTSRVSTLVFLAPFLSLFFIHHILGEQIQPTTYLGLVFIIVGLIVQRIGLTKSFSYR
jgi:hypothetical protein